VKDELSRLQDYWRDEMEAALTYERLSEAATDPHTRNLLLEMQDTERRHAARWHLRISADAYLQLFRGSQQFRRYGLDLPRVRSKAEHHRCQRFRSCCA